jgi:hypothetical protein
VAVPAEPDNRRIFPYVVTNSHVIREASATVIRLKLKDGSPYILETKDNIWIHHSDGDDVAVSGVGLNGASAEAFRFNWISSTKFITKSQVQRYNIGPGDEVFMVGRFIEHGGKETNLPVVRFGFIAMLPHEGIRHPRGIDQESFLVEMFSLGGFSGSPAFVYFRPFSLRPGPGEAPVTTVQTISQIEEKNIGPLLLGINWGHILSRLPVKDGVEQSVPNNWYVESNTGFAGVVPAWKIHELLYSDELIESRLSK